MSSEKKPTLAEIKARIQVVCICKGIKQGKIVEAIEKGCTTVEEVNKKTGSGNGGCGATRCRPKIEELIKNGGQVTPQKVPEEGNDDDDFFF